jgi:hypothetical protein
VDDLVLLVTGLPPVITTSPTNRVVIAGGPASFTVAASGSDPLSYQWRPRGVPIQNATNATYTLPLAQANDAAGGGQGYDVVITNLYGSATSLPPADLVVVLPVTITTQPADQTVDSGTDATFTVGASGTAPLSFQWWCNGAPIPWATNAVLVLHAVQTNQAGTYYAVVNNAGNIPTNSRSAQLTVNLVPAGYFIPDGVGFGSFSKTSDLYTVSGGGEDVKGTEDRFFFVYLPWRGDGEIMAKVKSLVPAPSSRQQSEAGLMFRAGMAGGARHVFLALDGKNRTVFRRRSSADAYPSMSQFGGLKMLIAGAVGDVFTVQATSNLAASSPTWLPIGTVTNVYGVVPFTDTQALARQVRFYRLQKVGP